MVIFQFAMLVYQRVIISLNDFRLQSMFKKARKQNPIQPFLLKLRMVHRTALCNATVDDIPIYFS
jgi:hypothetical protein